MFCIRAMAGFLQWSFPRLQAVFRYLTLICYPMISSSSPRTFSNVLAHLRSASAPSGRRRPFQQFQRIVRTAALQEIQVTVDGRRRRRASVPRVILPPICRGVLVHVGSCRVGYPRPLHVDVFVYDHLAAEVLLVQPAVDFAELVGVERLAFPGCLMGDLFRTRRTSSA